MLLHRLFIPLPIACCLSQHRCRVLSQWETLPRHRGGGEERSADRPATAAAVAPVRQVIAGGRGGALHSVNTSQYYVLAELYCDVDGATGSRGYVNSAFPRVTSRTTTPILTQHSVNTLPRETVTSSNRRARATTVGRISVNTTLDKSGTYHVTVFCVARAEPK
jgi:hypothetical protein